MRRYFWSLAPCAGASFSHFRTKSSAMFRYDVWSIWCSFLSFGFQNCQSYGPWMPQCSFRELRGSLGFHFCSSGCLLGCILGALGMPRPPFFHFWVSPGQHFGSLGGPLGYILAKLVVSGAPWGSQCPPSRPKPNFLKFCPPFLEAFRINFGAKNR